MTEQEAKQKWCPFARDAESNAAGYTTTNTTAKCIGSECMAWRYTNKTGLHSRDRWIDGPTQSADEAFDQYVKDFPLEGRCGLAGV